MVILSSGNSNEGNNESSPSLARNVLILEKLRQAHAKEQLNLNNNQSKLKTEQNNVDKTVDKKLLKLQQQKISSRNSFDRKIELIKRSTLQEKLFTKQYEISKQNCLKIKPIISNYSLHGSKLELENREKDVTYNYNNDDNADDVDDNGDEIEHVSKAGVLHLQKPCSNRKNKTIYYGHGRMEPMDCTVLNSKKNISEVKKANNIIQKKNDDDDDDDDDNDNDDDDDDEVEHVATAGVLHLKKPCCNKKNETIYYEDHGRMEPMDWEVLNSKTISEVKKANNIIQKNNEEIQNNIKNLSDDATEANDEFINFVENSITENTIYEVRGNLEQIRIATDSPLLRIQRMINKNKNKNVLSITPEIQKLFEPSEKKFHIIDIVDSKIKEETVQTNKNVIESDRTSEIQNISNFSNAQNTQINQFNENETICEFDSKDTISTLIKENSVVNTIKKQGVEEYDDEMFNFVKPEPKSDSFENKAKELDKNTNSHFGRFHFDKLKNYYDEKFNTSLDSDDTSLDRSSELEYSFNSKTSATAKFESLRKKLKNASTQYSSKSNQNINSNSTNITNIKIVQNEEPLLTAISTRYFSKSLEMNKNNIVVQKEMSKKIEEISNINDKHEFNKNDQSIVNFDEKNEFSEKQKEKKIIEEIPESIRKIYNENDVMYLDQNVALIENENVANKNVNIKKDNNDYSNSHEHINETSIIFQENINSESKEITLPVNAQKLDNEEQSLISVKENNLAVSDPIDSDEEFDIVNLEEFVPFNALLNTLKNIREAVNIDSINNKDLKSIDNDIVNNNNNNNKKIVSPYKTISSESSFEISDDSYSSISASVSNIDTDNEQNSSNSSNPLLNIKTNIFESVEIDNSQWENSYFNYTNDLMKSNSLINENSDKCGMSSRRKKMENALKAYQKNLKSDDTGEGSEEDQKLVDNLQNKSSTNSENIKHHQILNEIKKLKLHLNCKPMMSQKSSYKII